MGWSPNSDEKRQHQIILPENFDSFAILRKWDPVLTAGVWPAEVRSVKYRSHLSLSTKILRPLKLQKRLRCRNVSPENGSLKSVWNFNRSSS